MQEGWGAVLLKMPQKEVTSNQQLQATLGIRMNQNVMSFLRDRFPKLNTPICMAADSISTTVWKVLTQYADASFTEPIKAHKINIEA